MAERLMAAQRKLVEPTEPTELVEPTEPTELVEPTERVEEYEASKPDGTKVRVWHNIDTGETRIIE